MDEENIEQITVETKPRDHSETLSEDEEDKPSPSRPGKKVKVFNDE